MSDLKCGIIICTYKRPAALCKLLKSLCLQTLSLIEILVVDGSPGEETEKAIESLLSTLPIRYTRVRPEQRGLTRQRNVGVSLLSPDVEIVLFLDDDVVPEQDFVEQLLVPFRDASVMGVDGLITNECFWQPMPSGKSVRFFEHAFDGYYLHLPQRDILRKCLGLYPTRIQPGLIPAFGHGKSSLPPGGKCYEVEHLMGGITAYRRLVFDHVQFSTYFEGYGLYEDFDFSIRAGRLGKLLTNTAARIAHYHEPAGRPDAFKYGKMVVRNGWYVWRLKHPQPGRINVLKWHLIALLMAFIRLSNALTPHAEKRRQALGDFAGRMLAWVKLLFVKPLILK